MVTKKKAAKKAVKKSAALTNKKLHVVLGDGMAAFESKCADIQMSKSEVGRLLIEAFVEGTTKVIPAKVTSKKAIRA